MANSELNFSVRLQMLTDQFNQGLRESRSAFEAATQSIIGNTNDLRTNSTRAEQALTTLFNAPSNDLTATIQNTTAQLNGLVRGANISEEQLQRAFLTAANHVQNLSNDLDAARARLQNMTLAGASLTSIQQAQTEIAQLEQRLGQAQTASTELGNAMSSALNRASQTAQQTEASIDRLLGVRSNNVITSDINAISQALNHLQTEFEQGRISQQEFNRMTQAGEARLQSLQNELAGTTNNLAQLGGASQQADGGFGQLRNTLMGFAAAYVGIDSVVQGIQALIDTSKQMDSLNAKLEYATGGAKEAGETFSYLKDIANELGLEQMGLAEGYAQLAAATKGLNMSQEDTRTAFEGVAKAAAAMSLTADESNGVFLALSQIASKGKVSMEELRGQLGERLTPAFGIAAKAMGVTTSELEKMVENGINAKEFLPKFGAAMAQSFNDQAAKNINTTTGEINLLTNAVTDAKQALLKSFAGDAILDGINILTEGIKQADEAIDSINPATIDMVKNTVEQLGSIASTTFGEMVQLLNRIEENFQQIQTAINGTANEGERLTLIQSLILGINVSLGAFNDGLKTLGIAFDLAMGVSDKFFSKIAENLSKVTFGEVSDKLKAYAAELDKSSGEAFDRAQKKTMEFKSSAVEAMDKAAEAARNNMGEVGEKSEKAAQKSIESFDKLAKAGKSSGEELAAGFSEAISKATKPEQVDELINKYGQLAKEGKITGEQLAEGMNKAKIKSEELDNSVGRQIPTMAELAKAGEHTATDIKTRMSDTAQALGLNFDKASLGISESFRKTSAAVMDVGNNFDELKAQGYDASSLLVQGLDELLDSANNQKEIDTVRQMYVDFGKDGKLSTQQVEDGIDAVNKKLDKSPELLDETGRALKELGIISKAEGEQQAQEQIRNFEIAKKSYDDGLISAEQMRKAAEKVGRTVEASGNASQQSWLDSQKSALGVKDAVDKTTDSTERLTRSTSSVGEGFKSAARLSVQELEEVSKKLDFLNTKNKELQAQWAKESAARDEGNRATTAKSMQSVANYSTLTAMENFLKSAGLNDKQAMEQAQSLMNRYGKNGRMNWTAANGLTEGAALTTQQMANFKDPTAYLLDIAEKIRYNQAALDRQTAIVEQNKQASANRTVNVNLNFDGQSLPMTIDADKEALFMDFVNRLQSDSKRQAR